MSDSNYDSTSESWWLLLTLAVVSIAVFLLAYWGHNKLIKVYENNSYKQDHYIDSSEYRSFSLELLESCSPSKQQTDEQQYRCKEIREIISTFSGLSDLRAQQTMATATRGVLYGAWFQYLASLLGVGVVAVTLFATWRMLRQAANTSRFARQTLDAANAATDAAKSAEKPYVDVELICEFTGESRSQNTEFRIIPTVTNFGKTPAKKVKVSVWPITSNCIDTVSYKCVERIETLAANIPREFRVQHRDGGSENTFETMHSNSLKFAVLWSYDDVFGGETQTNRYSGWVALHTPSGFRATDSGNLSPEYLDKVTAITFTRAESDSITNWGEIEQQHSYKRSE